MKLKEFDLEKDFGDFAKTFNQFNGETASSMTGEKMILYMMCVTEELKRLHQQVNQTIREVLELQREDVPPTNKKE